MHPETAAELCRCIFTAEMTGAEKLIWGSPFGRRLLMAVDAVPCGRGDGRRQAMIQSALVATLRTASAAAWSAGTARAGLARTTRHPPRPPRTSRSSRPASPSTLSSNRRPGPPRPSRPSLPLAAKAPDPGLRAALRPDELVVDRATVTAGDAAGDLPGPPGEAGVPCGGRDAAGELPGPPGEAGVPCGGRDAGATPFAEGVTTGGQPCPVVWGTGQPWVLRASSSQSNMRCSRRERAIGSQCMSAPSASVNGTSTLGPGRAS